MSLFACGRIHQGLDPERFTDESLGRCEIYMCLAALFDDSRIVGGTKISIKSSFWRWFFLCAFNRSDVLSKNYILLFEVNCQLYLAGLGKKWEQSKPALCKRLQYHMYM